MAGSLELSEARFALAEGLFSTDNRYIRQVSDPARKTINLARGPTIELNIQFVGGSTYAASWRWRVGSATQVGVDASGIAYDIEPPDGFNTPLDISL